MLLLLLLDDTALIHSSPLSNFLFFLLGFS